MFAFKFISLCTHERSAEDLSHDLEVPETISLPLNDDENEALRRIPDLGSDKKGFA